VKKLVTLFFILGFSFSALAGGFQINEHGARAMGMGGAFTAVANDASAIYWNGANLVNLYGTNFVLGTALIAPSTTLLPSSTLGALGFSTAEQKMESQIFFPSHFFASTRISKDFAAGLGFTSPFGLGTKWEDDWTGRYLAVETELQIFTISPVLAYRLTEGLSVSAGFVYSFANVTISRQVPQPSQVPGETFVAMEGDDMSAFGYNLGLMYKPSKRFSAGVSFHSEIEYNFEGDATATTNFPTYAALFNGGIKADLTTPLNLAVGVAYEFTPELLVSADFQYVGWSSYDSLTVLFDTPLGRSSSAREYENSFITRLGAHYNVSNVLGLQAGVYYDKNPVKPERINPTLPESDRLGLSFGVEYDVTKNFGIHLSYLYIHSFEITIDNSEERLLPPGPSVPESVSAASALNGTYNSSASLFSLSLSYGF
jgi:long-chain fatty acid transport protein